MKNIWLIAALLLASFANIHHASAFSEDKGANVNTDGSAKYTDPDEQVPGFMTSPDEVETGSNLSFGASTVTRPSPSDNDNGARSFDQAFSHQQDKQ